MTLCQEKKPRQQNLWLGSGSGRCSRLWYKANPIASYLDVVFTERFITDPVLFVFDAPVATPPFEQAGGI